MLPDSAAGAGQKKMFTGHYGATDAGVTVVRSPAKYYGASRRGVRDVVNTTSQGGGAASFYITTVVCQDPSTNREQELEFVFQYSL